MHITSLTLSNPRHFEAAHGFNSSFITQGMKNMLRVCLIGVWAIGIRSIGLGGIGIASIILLFPHTASAANSEQYYEKALQSFHQNEFDSSVIHLKNLLQQQPNHLAARLLLAENLLAQGKATLAESEVHALNQSGADRNRTMPLLAQSLLLQGKNQQILNIAIPTNAKSAIQAKLTAYRGLAYLNVNKLVLAKNEFAEALNLNKKSTLAMIGTAKLHIKQKEWPTAITKINQVLALKPDHQQALLMSAIVNQLLGNSKQALTSVNKVLLSSPSHFSALLTRAMILINRGELALASIDIKQVANTFPREPITHFAGSLIKQEKQPTLTHANNDMQLSSLVDEISDEMKQQQPVYYLLSALANIKQQAFIKAEKALNQYHRLVPNDVAALTLLARTRIALNNAFTAKKDLFKARTLAPENIEIWFLLGHVSILTGEIEKAKYHFNQVLKAEPNHVEARVNLAKLHFIKADATETIAELSPLLAKDNAENFVIASASPDLQAEILLMLAKAHQQQKQISPALNYTKMLIELQANNSYAHQLHGSLLGLLGNIKAAHQSYLTAHNLDKNNFQVVIRLARLETALGKTQQAISRLNKNNKKRANSAVMIELGDTYLAHTDSNSHIKAQSWYEKALAHNPASLLALNKLTTLFSNTKELERALRLIESFLEKNDKNSAAYELAAQLFLQAGNSNKALKYMNRAIKLTTVKAPKFVKLAKLQLKLNQIESAKLSLEKAIAWDNGLIESYTLLIALANSAKNENDALTLIKKLENVLSNHNSELSNEDDVKRNKHKTSRPLLPQHKTLILNLTADLYWALADLPKATALYKKSIVLKPTSAAITGLYRIYRRQQQFSKISTLLETWLTEQPDDLQMTIALGENYRQNGEAEKAMNLYNLMLSINPNNVLLLNNAAILYKEEYALDKALLLADKAYQLAPNNVNIIDTKASVLIERMSYQSALPLLRKANALDYDNAEVKYHLAVALLQLDRKNEAKTYLVEAVESEQNFYEKSDAKALLTQWK